MTDSSRRCAPAASVSSSSSTSSPNARAEAGATFDALNTTTVPAPFLVGNVLRTDHADRSESQEATADLLFFPTGGGKSEAYLGLSAYTMGLRRLQGTVAGRSGENGIAS